MAHNFFVACKKGMGKKSVDPESKSIAGEPKLMGKLANKIMHNLDIDKLADAVA